MTIEKAVAAVVALAAGSRDEGVQAMAAEAEIHKVGGWNTNHVWTAVVDSQPIVIKVFVGQQPDGAQREWSGLQHFGAVTPEQVPRPLLFDEERAAIAMTRLPGDPLADQPLTVGQVEELARWLRVTWSPCSDVVSLPAARTAPSELVPRTRRWWAGLKTTPVEDEVVRSALDAADEWLAGPELDSLLELPCDVIIRGDSNLANCLWSLGGLAMVDFEDAGWNHAAVFLGDLIEHIRARANPESTWQTLLDAVEISKSDRAAVLVARRRFAIFWLMHLLPRGRAAERNPRGTLEQQAERVLALLA